MNSGDASPLEQLVDSIRSGGQLDSQGSFTLQFGAAVEKIGLEAKAQPQRWLQFMIQAGVAAGAQEVQVTCNRKLISVEWQLTDWPPELDAPRQLLSSQGKSALNQLLRSAVLWGLGLKPDSMELLYRGPREGYLMRLVADQEEFSQLAGEPNQPHRLSLLWRPSLQTQNGLLAWLRQSEVTTTLSALAENLQPRFRYAPLIIRLGQRCLERGEPLVPASQALIYRRLYLVPPGAPACLAAAPCYRWPAAQLGTRWGALAPSRHDDLGLPELGLLELCGEIPRKSQIELYEGPTPPNHLEVFRTSGKVLSLPLGYDPCLRSDVPEVRCKALAYRTDKPAGDLLFVKYGMTLNSLRIPGLADHGWTVVVAANSLNTDLTGLEPVRGEPIEQVITWTYSELDQLYQRQ